MMMVVVVVAFSAIEYAHKLIHQEKEEEASKDTQADEHILLLIDLDGDVLLNVLAEECVRKQVKENVSQKST